MPTPMATGPDSPMASAARVAPNHTSTLPTNDRANVALSGSNGRLGMYVSSFLADA